MSQFGSKRVEWAGEEIATIGIGHSGLKVQGVPVVELQVQPIDGGQLGVLAGRDRTELDWIVYDFAAGVACAAAGSLTAAKKS